MPFLIFVSYIALEIYVFNVVWERFGFVNMVFALMAGAILGIGLVRNQGRYVLRKMQDAVARGQTPADEVLHGLLIFLGGLLFIIPGFVSDLIALILVLPGTRHLCVALFKPRLGRQMASGGFRVFTFGNVTMDRTQPFNEPPSDGFVRDVSPKVIDVTPIKSDHRERSE